jgi:hypothetical protein
MYVCMYVCMYVSNYSSILIGFELFQTIPYNPIQYICHRSSIFPRIKIRKTVKLSPKGHFLDIVYWIYCTPLPTFIQYTICRMPDGPTDGIRTYAGVLHVHACALLYMHTCIHEYTAYTAYFTLHTHCIGTHCIRASSKKQFRVQV